MRIPSFLTLFCRGAVFIATLLVSLLLLAGACQDAGVVPEENRGEDVQQDSTSAEKAVRLRRNGKTIGAPKLANIYTITSLDSIDVPFIEKEVLDALGTNTALLQLKKRKRHYQIANLRVEPVDLLATISILKRMQYTKPLNLEDYLDAHKIWGEDQRGHVRFTGYFTPIIKVSRKKEGKFQYPIYSRPVKWEGKLPSRAEIEGEGVLDTMGLELAYAANKVDVYYMQVQGSGFVEYPNGKKELFAYNGNNRYPYRSIEKYIISRPDIELSDLSISGIKKYLYTHPELRDTILFQNPSYTFFIRKKSQPKGAGGVPLIADFSIAVDRRYIPLGACLIAAFPIYDHRLQKVVRHDLRFFMAHDVGGAIKGPGHVDVYTGVGKEAAAKAGKINSYGHLWLLLPKSPRARFISNTRLN
jgi:membrane-bound lytic murein transglycosylase A